MENEVNIEKPEVGSEFQLNVNDDKPEVGSEFQLNVDDEKLEVVLSIDALTAAVSDTADKILEKLTEMGIDNLPELELIQTRLEETKYDGDQMQEIVIVRGKSSVMPVDGRLVWSKDYFAKGYKIDITTNIIDFREKVASPVVLEDDLIIKIIPPTPGEDGIDVYGNLIKVNPPAKAEIKVGPNLRWDEEASGYLAAVSGRLRMPGASLEIQEVFSIEGDVGRKTGNIKHEGDIIIRGDIDSEYNVEATKTILVTGVIGACNVTSGGDLIVNGGISGREDKKINAKGGIKAKYIMNAVLEAGGNVASEVEIVKSRILSVCSGSTLIFCVDKAADSSASVSSDFSDFLISSRVITFLSLPAISAIIFVPAIISPPTIRPLQ